MTHDGNVIAAGWLRKKLHALKKPAVISAAASTSGKWRREKPVTLAWLARWGIAARKTHRGLRTQRAAILLSNRRRILTCFFVPRDLDLWFFWFHNSSWKFVCRLVILAASVCEISCRQQTNRQTNAGENPTDATAVNVVNNNMQRLTRRVRIRREYRSMSYVDIGFTKILYSLYRFFGLS